MVRSQDKTSKNFIRTILPCAMLSLSVLAVGCAHADRDDRWDRGEGRSYDRADQSDRDRDRDDHHRVSSILWTCGVSFRASGRSIRIGIGYTDLDGHGRITCYDVLTGRRQEIPIRVQAEGPAVGIGVTSLNLVAAATGIGISSRPESLLGRYLVLRADAAVGIGAGAAAGIRVSRGSVSFDVSLQGEKGLGVGADLVSLRLIEDEDHDRDLPRVSDFPPAQQWQQPSSVVQVAQLQPAPVQQLPAQQLAPVQQQVAAAPAMTAPTPAPIQTVYVGDGQPVQLVDSSGKLIKIIYLKRK